MSPPPNEWGEKKKGTADMGRPLFDVCGPAFASLHVNKNKQPLRQCVVTMLKFHA